MAGEAALAYLRAGLGVVPLRPRDKKPLVAWKEYQGRHATEAEVIGWYRQWPDAGVAVVCGQVSGLVVLDSDPRNGDGLASIAHRLPPTPTVETGSGGRHLWFRAGGVPVPRAPALLPGLDLQAEASLATVPPSIHPNGRPYRWLPGLGFGEVPLAPVPPIVRSLLALRFAPVDPPTRCRRPSPGATLTLDGVLGALEGVQRSGGGWVARCPAHQDREPSLSIGQGADGRVLLHCFAGCDFGAVVAALHQGAVA